jgi:hypothetical protein
VHELLEHFKIVDFAPKVAGVVGQPDRGILGNGPSFDKTMGRFALAYAQQTEAEQPPFFARSRAAVSQLKSEYV